MPSQVRNAPASVVSDPSNGGDEAWSTPLTAAVGLNASFSLLLSQFLKCTDFGFSIPAGETINGIVVRFDRYRVNNSGTADLEGVALQLVKGGTPQGDDKSDGQWPNDTAEQHEAGGSSDLWGLSWTPSDINASNFGAVIACQIAEGSEDGFVEAVEIEVFYGASSGEDPAATGGYLNPLV